MSRPTIRPMLPADIPSVVQLAQALPEAPHWSPEAYRIALDPLAAPRRLALVAERDGQLAGFAVLAVVADEAELESIAVAESARRQGVGRLLLLHLTKMTQAGKLARMFLEVRASNARALSFYHATGWRVCGQRKRYYVDPEEDAVLMACEIAASAGPQPL